MAGFGQNDQRVQPSAGFGGHDIVIDLPAEDVIDRRTGAPGRVRNLVGGARGPDRLNTLRQFYPDAEPYGNDNFVFTDPGTGRLTLYNPKGLDAGDLPSITPELAEMAGGVIGGALAVPPAVLGAPATGGASTLLVPAGIGLGAAAGSDIEQMIAQFMGRVDTRSLPRKALDNAITAGVNAAGQRVADVAIQGVNKLVGPPIRRLFTHSRPQDLLAAYERQGVDPMAGAVSGSRPVQIAEHALSYTPGGSAPMQAATERTVGQVGQAAGRLASSVGGQETPQIVGGMLRNGADAAAQRFVKQREGLDAALETVIGRDTATPVNAVSTLLRQLKGDLKLAPRSRQADLSRAIQELEAIQADAGQAGIPFGTLRQIRTRIGRDLDRPDISGYRPGEQGAMARVYGALTEDVKNAAAAAGPAAQKALALHDRYVRYQRTINLPILDELAKQKFDEKIFNWALQGGREGGTRLLRLRYNMRTQAGEGTWDEMVSSVLTRMGQAKPGQQGVPVDLLGPGDTFSPGTFLTNFASLSPEAKSALFGGKRYQALREGLDDLVKISASLKDAEKMANTSGTARGLLFTTLGLTAGQVMTGNVGGAAGTIAGAVVAPYVAARLITNPRFVRWLAVTRMLGNDPNSITRHLGRLVAIAEAEPEIRDDVHQYLDTLRPASTAPAPATTAVQPR
jgi:hypothetical protein